MTVPHHPNEAHTNLKVAKHFRCLSSYQYTCNIYIYIQEANMWLGRHYGPNYLLV
jgi:hypothetical protein